MSIGRIGYGYSADASKLSSCSFLLISAAAASKSVALADPPFHLLTDGLLELDGCAIGSQENFVLRLYNLGTLVARDTNIFYSYQGSRVTVGFHAPEKAAVDRVMLLSGSTLIQEHPEWSRWSRASLDNGGLKALTMGANIATGTIPMTSTANVDVGDLVGLLEGGGGTIWAPDFIAAPTGGTVVPWGVVTSVTVNTSITLSYLGKGVPFGGSTALQRFRWDGTATDGGVVGLGVLYTRGDVDPNRPVVGDAVYLSSDDTVKKAKASSTTTMPAIGIVTSLASNGSKVRVALFGQGAIENASLSIAAGTRYFVSRSAAGAITSSLSGFDTGDVVQKSAWPARRRRWRRAFPATSRCSDHLVGNVAHRWATLPKRRR